MKSTKWDKYLKLVEEALKNYQECESSNCSCYKRQLDLDLEPWKADGIKKSLLNDIEKVERLSHYQIIDHKLYANGEKMFPAR